MSIDEGGRGSERSFGLQLLGLVLPVVLVVGVPLLMFFGQVLVAVFVLLGEHIGELAVAAAWIGGTMVLGRLSATRRVGSVLVCHGPYALWFAYCVVRVVTTLGTVPIEVLRNVGAVLLHAAFTFASLDLRRPTVGGVLLSVLVNGLLFITNILIDPPETTANFLVQLLYRTGFLVVSVSLFRRAGELYGTTEGVPQ